MSATPPRRTIWIDVEDVACYRTTPEFRETRKLVLPLLQALPERAAQHGGGVHIGFVRHAGDGSPPYAITPDSVLQLLLQPPAEPSPPADRVAAAVPVAQPVPLAPSEALNRRIRRIIIKLIQSLPPGVAGILLKAGVRQLALLRRSGLHAAAPNAAQGQPIPVIAPPPLPRPPQQPELQCQPGDIYLVLGAPWLHRNYAALLQRLVQTQQVKPVLLLHDLSPLRRPDWYAADLAPSFAKWLTASLPLYHHVLATSRTLVGELEIYGRNNAILVRAPASVVPVASGIAAGLANTGPGTLPSAGLPPANSYVLCPGTLEARKNSGLLFRVWRRLVDEMPRAHVPVLVFAGDIGSMVADLLQQLENAEWLQGKVRLFRDPGNAELAALYQRCRFTVFASHDEGWAWAVSESLGFGRPCLASRRSAMIEAGGTLVRYFDPENVDEAYSVIRAAIEDPDTVEHWRARIQREFRPVSWQQMADAILTACIEDAPVRPIQPSMEQAS